MTKIKKNVKQSGGLKKKLKFKKTKKNFPLISIIMPNYKSKTLTKKVLNQY